MLSSNALSGVTVLALEQAVAAPLCTVKLADAGARVIKVERAEGDFARAYDTSAAGLSSYFVWLNRGKESLVANIKDPQDAELLHKILRSADVFVQNLAPGAAERAGFGSSSLRQKYPRLITVDISGYGDCAAYHDMKAYDLLVQAETGLASITGTPEGPARVGVSVSDIACGMEANSAVLEALIRRSKTGEGCSVQISLFDATADWMNVPLIYYEGTGHVPQRIGLAHPTLCPYGAFETAGGRAILISIQNEREWSSFCSHVLKDEHLPKQIGFETSSARVANRAQVDAKVQSAFGSLSETDAVERLRTAGTAYGFVNDLAGLARHPALTRAKVSTPNGPVNLIAPASSINGERRVLEAVPSIGQHTNNIRVEFGG